MKRPVQLIVILLVTAATLDAKPLSFEGSVSAGAVVSDNEKVSASPVLKVDGGWKLTKHFKLGAQLGQAFGFGEKTPASDLVNGKQDNGVHTYTTKTAKKFHEHDGDIIIVEGDDVTIVNIFPTPVPDPYYANLNESRYLFAEPYAALIAPVSNRLSIYGKAFMGVARLTTHGNETDNGLSYGFGGGVDYALMDYVLFKLVAHAEVLNRAIEIGKHGYRGTEYTGGLRAEVGF